MDFINQELKKLDNLQGKFNNKEKEQYKEEVDYINSLLQVLKKRQQPQPQPQQPQLQPQPPLQPVERSSTPLDRQSPDRQSPAKPVKKKDKKDDRKELHKFVGNFSLKRATDISMNELPEDVILDAKLSKISDKIYKTGGIDSENFMEQAGIKDWKIDNELTNDKGVVAVNEKTGRVKVSYRGTDAKGMNMSDIEADARIYTGTEADHEHFTSAREQMKNTIKKYGKANIDTVSGFSLGGNKSWTIGNEFKIKSRGFNSFIGKSIVNKADNYDPETEHEIYRTQDDLPSIQSQYINGKNNTTIHTLSTLGDSYAGLNPYTAHSIDNFITNEGRNSNNKSVISGKIEGLVNHSVKHGELRTLHEMTKQNKRYDVKGDIGEINETDYMNRLNDIDNTLTERSRNNALTRADRLEVKARARARFDDYRTETRGDDFTGGLEPDTLINRNDPKYQSNLDTKANNLPKPHLPKKKLPENVLNEINTYDDAERFLQDYNQDGTPKEELTPPKKVNIRKQTQALETGRDYLNNRGSRGNYAFIPEVDTLGNQTRALEQRLLNTKDTFNIRDKTKARLLKKSKTISPADKNMLIKKKKLTEPPTERKTENSKKLSRQTELIEKSLDTSEIQPDISQPTQSDLSFTEWANKNNIGKTDHKKTLWEKSGGRLTNEEKNNFTDTTTYNNETTLNNFNEADLNERNNILDNLSTTQKSLETDLNNTMETPIRSSGGGNWKMDVARGVHPQNLVLGYLSDKGAKSIMDTYVKPTLGKQGEFMETGERGGIAGGLTAVALGTAILPEVVAGSGGYVAQKYATEGIYKGLKKVGASDDVAGVSASVGGGITGGAIAGALGSAISGALVGTEDGAVAGGGIFSAETATIGGIIGGIVGLGSYAYGKING